MHFYRLTLATMQNSGLKNFSYFQTLQTLKIIKEKFFCKCQLQILDTFPTFYPSALILASGNIVFVYLEIVGRYVEAYTWVPWIGIPGG